MRPPKVSVVIPVFNEEKYIADCIGSIKAQSFKDYELIVVDNNSTDKTAKIAYGLGAKLLKEEKQGRTQAIQKGFNWAKGEIIARIDADARAFPDWLEKL